MALPFFRWSLCIVGAVALGALVFELMGISVFSRIGMPHEFCYLRDPKLVWLHVVSDCLIGLAYVSISSTLAYLVYKASKGIPFHWVFLAFGLFIVSCGLTHFMEVWVIWEPVYWLSGYVKVITAAASVATAIVLFPLVPKIFKLIESARKSEERRLEIEQLNQELERFNYSVAHDLRAPLRGIAGFSGILREDYAAQLPPEALDYLDKMQQSVGKMDTLISDLLKYAVLSRQAMKLKPVALDEVLRSTITLMDADITLRNATISAPQPLPVIVSDAVMLQVIFRNLIGNGIKFTAAGVRPEVTITGEIKKGVATILFTDNGLGIPDEAKDRIFGLFERFHPEYSGTGIGLPMVQRATERLNGKIGFTSAPTGTGTCFWVQLPVGDLRDQGR
ncbi:sensor histidine kinase [Rariglobus hedericola]|uniref:sensor histidine kinase n=1 Tax=Rariglobus hedericola TaxID=2597822 RepID=UPI0013969BEC|nr:ATP-binding protein [Rariglobus hedericola]